jgi:hypothetical protein
MDLVHGGPLTRHTPGPWFHGPSPQNSQCALCKLGPLFLSNPVTIPCLLENSLATPCYLQLILEIDPASHTYTAPVRLSFQPYFFSEGTMFFSYNKSTNNTFQFVFLAKRIVFRSNLFWYMTCVICGDNVMSCSASCCKFYKLIRLLFHHQSNTCITSLVSANTRLTSTLVCSFCDE